MCRGRRWSNVCVLMWCDVLLLVLMDVERQTVCWYCDLIMQDVVWTQFMSLHDYITHRQLVYCWVISWYVCGCCVPVQCENVDNMSVIWSNVGWHRDKSTGHCTVCVGPGSCRVSPIHFLSRWHKRPRNQALVSFGFACAWLFLVCVFLVVVMLSFAPVEWLAGRVVSEMIIWSAELDIKLHSTDSLTCWLLSVNMMMMI